MAPQNNLNIYKNLYKKIISVRNSRVDEAFQWVLQVCSESDLQKSWRLVNVDTTQIETTKRRTENIEISGSEGISILVAGVALYHLNISRIVNTVSTHVEHG